MKELDYGKTPIKKLILKLAIPSIITMIVASINMVVDGIFMGNFIGSKAMAAVNLIMPIALLVFAIFDMVASGSSVRISVLLGEKKEKKASEIFSSSMLIIFITSIIVSLVLILFSKDLIFMLISDVELASLAYEYVKPLMYTLPLIAPLFAFDNFLIICGKTKKSMWINIITSIINIALSTYFIAYLNLGVFYAGLSTAISMSIGAVLSILPFIKNKLELKFTRPRMKLKDLKMIIFNGSSEFFESLSSSFMGTLTNVIMLSVAGANGVAAMSIIVYIEMLLLPILGGIIGSIQPIVSYNYGAKKYDRVKQTFKIVSIASGVISIVSLLIMLLFPEFLVGLFTDNQDIELINLAVTGLMLYAPSYLFTWFNIVAGTFLTSLEKPTQSIILMALDSIVLPLILFVTLVQLIGVNGMFISQTISAGITFVVAVIMWKKIYKLFDEKKEKIPA